MTRAMAVAQRGHNGVLFVQCHRNPYFGKVLSTTSSTPDRFARTVAEKVSFRSGDGDRRRYCSLSSSAVLDGSARLGQFLPVVRLNRAPARASMHLSSVFSPQSAFLSSPENTKKNVSNTGFPVPSSAASFATTTERGRGFDAEGGDEATVTAATTTRPTTLDHLHELLSRVDESHDLAHLARTHQLEEVTAMMMMMDQDLSSLRQQQHTSYPPFGGNKGIDRSRRRRRSVREVTTDLCKSYLSLPPITLLHGRTRQKNGKEQSTSSNNNNRNDRNDVYNDGTTTSQNTNSNNNNNNNIQCHETRQDVIQYLAAHCGYDPNDTSLSSAIESYHQHLQSVQIQNTLYAIKHKLSVVKKLREDVCTPGYEKLMRTVVSEAEIQWGMYFVIALREDLNVYVRCLEEEAVDAGSGSGDVSIKRRKFQKFEGDEKRDGIKSNGQRFDEEEEEEDYKKAMDDAMIMVTLLRRMDEDLKRMLSIWFSSGMLELRRITYDQTPASIIEKIAMKEAVHPLKSLSDLRQRLGHGRRCFAFFHPSLPDEPLVFVHVALLPHIPESMGEIDEHTTKKSSSTQEESNHRQSEDVYEMSSPRVATFYSITSTQSGLSGVDLGNFLIKRVVEILRMEFPQIETFVTLSPLPRFRKWLEGKLLQKNDISNTKESSSSKFIDDTMFTREEKEKLCIALKCRSTEDVPHALLDALDTPSWHQRNNLAETLRPILMKLAARYLVLEKHRGRPLDGVAKFHIRNGAEMHRLNYLADTSRKGMHNGAGIMVNYRYCFDTIEENNVLHEMTGQIPVCEGVSMWLPKKEEGEDARHGK